MRKKQKFAWKFRYVDLDNEAFTLNSKGEKAKSVKHFTGTEEEAK